MISDLLNRRDETFPPIFDAKNAARVVLVSQTIAAKRSRNPNGRIGIGKIFACEDYVVICAP
jgi:hypothetical protein